MLSHLRFKRVFLFDVDLLVISEKNRAYPLFFAFNRHIRASVYDRTYKKSRLDPLKNNFLI